MKHLNPENFLGLRTPILDTRSPAEYQQGHIEGAHSFPLFSDEERALVGTTFKQKGQKEAFKLGLSLVGPKMRSFIELAENYASEELRVHCWRGGMRSSSMGWLLEQYGFRVTVLAGGYKAYRNHILDSFKKPLNLKILTGLTGSGKTEILKEMRNQGAQVIDLEGLANHPGSSFGNQLHLPQPSTEMFQNMIFHSLERFNLQKTIWLEDESFCIGQVHMPEDLFYQMRESPRYQLILPKEVRQEYLVSQYGNMGKVNLIEATRAIRKKLGTEQTEKALELIESGHLFEAAGVLLTYYDRMYGKNMGKVENADLAVIESGNLCPAELAREIIKKYGS